MSPDATHPPYPWEPTGPLREPPRSILIVMMSAVGDAVMVLPVVRALRRTFPDVHITWVLQPGPAALIRDHPAVDRIVLFHRTRGRSPGTLLGEVANLRRTVRGLRELARTLPGGSFDLLLDLQVYLKAGLLTALAPARIKLGFDRRRARDLNWAFTTHRIPPHAGRFGHVQDQYFEFLRHLGVDPEPLEYGLHLTEEEERQQEAFFSDIRTPACGVVVGTSDPTKNWSPKHFAQLLDGVWNRFRLHPLLLGGRSGVEDALASEIRSRATAPVEDARADDLRRLLWLLDGCRVVVSPDTGPMHLARALEVPVVSLFGATNPKRSGPYRMFQELVVDGYARYPGEDYPLTPRRRPGGMDRITPAVVLERVESALRGRDRV